MRKPRVLRLILAAPFYLIAGATAAVAVAALIAARVDVFQVQATSASAFDGRAIWNVACWERTGIICISSARDTQRTSSWSVRQATGPPNTPGSGDIPTAWASLSSSGGIEWLELTYSHAVLPSHIVVHETYHPGAVFRVTAYTPDGKEADAWKGTDPAPRGSPRFESHIPLNVEFITNRVRVYLDSRAVPGWNEIDAVALVDREGKTQWAIDAMASSAYSAGAQSNGAAAVDAIVPPWSGLRQPTPQLTSGQADTEDRVVAAYGWPWMCLLGERTALAPQPGAGAAFPASPPSGSGRTLTPYNGALDFGGESQPVTTGFLPSVPPGSFPSGRPSGPTAASSIPSGAITVPAPRRMLWKGLAADTLVFAAVLAALRWAMVRPHRFLVESSRIRRGCCLVCGYDLRYDFVPGCPECGWRRGASHRSGPVHHAGTEQESGRTMLAP